MREPLAAGRWVVLEIDVQGALQVRDVFPDAILVFLLPPSPDDLVVRLQRRGTESAERIAERMAIARWEIEQAGRFDHRIVNDDLEAAVAALVRILDS